MKIVNFIFKTLLISFLSLVFIMSNSFAHDDHNFESITIENPIVREVPPVSVATAAFVTLHNASDKDIFLVGAATNIAKTVELHTHTMENGMMKMREVKNIKIPAKGSVELKPGGLHIMLIDLTKDLTKINEVTLKLLYGDGSLKRFIFPIKSVKTSMNKKKTAIRPLKKSRTIDLCANYSTHDSETKKDEVMKELLARNQLSERDLESIKTGSIENSNTMCGMYMVLGKPISEKSRQLRVMVFKSVHVYPKNYYVTQMGMVVAKHDRDEGSIPPSLSTPMPKVQGPPVTFIAPGGRPMH